MIAALFALLFAQPLPLELSLRAGYAKSFGQLHSTPAIDLSTAADNLLPLSVDIRYRVHGPWSFATSAEAAPVLSCAGRDCKASAFRVAAFAHWQPRDGDWRPFAALGLGYEWLRHSQRMFLADANGEVADVQLAFVDQGLAYAIAQAGVERALSDSVRLGPYALFSLGKYSEESLQLSPPVTPVGPAPPGGVHGFAQVGLRLSFEP